MREGHRTVSRVVSIKRRLTAIIMGTSVVALVLASTAFLVYDRRTSRKAMLQSQSALAEFIGTQSTAALTFRYRQKAQEILAGLSVQQNLLLACLYTKESWEFARYAPAGGAGPCPKQPESDFHRFQDDALTLSKPVMLDGESIGVIYLRTDTGHMRAHLRGNRRIIWVILASTLFVVFLLCSRLQRSISMPILELVRTAKAVSENQDYSARAVKYGSDEIGELVEVFNQMLIQIQRHDKELRQEIRTRKEAEENLRILMAKLKRSNRDLEQFAFIVSHDLQEPLRKVQAFGDRLKNAVGGSLSEKGRDYLERMQNAARRMQVLINDLLTFSRVASQAQPFLPVNLTAVVREVISDLEVRIEQVGGQVRLDELARLNADAFQMRQLFQNLISNALKFRHPDQKPVVKISGKALQANGHPPKSGESNGYYQISIEDNGIGFEERYVERIFAIFQRLHNRSQYEGSGMGLAICRKIVKRHGGVITAKSIPGNGSVFIVTLPRNPSQQEERRRNEKTGARGL